MSEVHVDVEVTFQCFMLLELDAVVVGDGDTFSLWEFFETSGRCFSHGLGCRMLDLVGIEHAALAIHMRDDVLFLIRSDDRVALEVTKTFSFFNDLRPCFDTLLLGIFSAFLPDFGAVSASVLALATSKKFHEFRPLCVDVPIDGLVADGRASSIFFLHASHDLLRRPKLFDPCFDAHRERRSVYKFSQRGICRPASFQTFMVRGDADVPRFALERVSQELPSDRRPVATEHLRNVSVRLS